VIEVDLVNAIRNGLAPQTTLEGLISPVLTVPASRSCREVDELFRANAELRCAVVVDGDRRGLLMRDSFEHLMAGPFGFGRALLARMAVGDAADWAPLRLPVDTPVEAASLMARARSSAQTYDDLLVERDGGVVGGISAAAVFDALARLYAHRATHDELTGLANRSHLLDRLAAACADARGGGERVVLAYVDLDGMKRVNDAHGHHLGDAVLLVAAQRMARAAVSGELVARLGGDEFAVLARMPHRDAVEPSAYALGQRLELAVAAPDGHTPVDVRITASVGVAVSGSAADPQTLLSEADLAMYRSKEGGGARTTVVTRVGSALAAGGSDSGRTVRQAIAAGELRLAYQPIIDVRDGSVVAIEALVRWQHPHYGLLHPDRFLPAAHRVGDGVDLDRWVLTRACDDMASLIREHGRRAPAHVNVNVSAALLARSIDDSVAAALEAADLPGDRLRLELSEDADLDTLSRAASRLEVLRRSGVGLVLDDMGTGSTSLRYLSQLPLHGLKIDRTFVGGVLHNPGDYTVVKLLADLAHGLGLGVVAEGVESAAQLNVLLDLGIRHAQGYHVGRPQPIEELATLLTART
jgi:diguanylate cyclase (GGDEF)-like protein